MRLAVSRNVWVVIVGAAASWVVLSLVVWSLLRTESIPVSKPTQLAAEAETGKESTDDVFALLRGMLWHIEWVVGPVVAAVVGVLVGSLSRTRQWLCALVAVLPVGIVVSGLPGVSAWRGPLVMAVVTSTCAHLTGLGMKRLNRYGACR
jgi:hypothetical protein